MIENVKSFKDLKKILSVKGLDAILIGPYDLSASLGFPGNFKIKKFKNAINPDRIEINMTPKSEYPHPPEAKD